MFGSSASSEAAKFMSFFYVFEELFSCWREAQKLCLFVACQLCHLLWLKISLSKCLVADTKGIWTSSNRVKSTCACHAEKRHDIKIARSCNVSKRPFHACSRSGPAGGNIVLIEHHENRKITHAFELLAIRLIVLSIFAFLYLAVRTPPFSI